MRRSRKAREEAEIEEMAARSGELARKPARRLEIRVGTLGAASGGRRMGGADEAEGEPEEPERGAYWTHWEARPARRPPAPGRCASNMRGYQPRRSRRHRAPHAKTGQIAARAVTISTRRRDGARGHGAEKRRHASARGSRFRPAAAQVLSDAQLRGRRFGRAALTGAERGIEAIERRAIGADDLRVPRPCRARYAG